MRETVIDQVSIVLFRALLVLEVRCAFLVVVDLVYQFEDKLVGTVFALGNGLDPAAEEVPHVGFAALVLFDHGVQRNNFHLLVHLLFCASVSDLLLVFLFN
jgi:hypothetical protein